MIRTVLQDLLGIEYPIIQGGMAWVSTPELAVGVSEAGGLGVLAAGNTTPEHVLGQIRQTKVLTSRPFGVNIALFSPFVPDVVRICIEEKVPVVLTGAGSPAQIMPRLKAAGIKVIPVVASVALAVRLVRNGADALVAEGMESGGHVGDVATMPLVPQVVDAVGEVPVVAAGGFADGRGLLAALALGAVGIQMGTRFICTEECTVHPAYKERLLRAHDRATVVTGHSLGHPIRAIRNNMTTRFAELERTGVSEADIIEFGTGRLRLAAVQGDVINGSVMSGQIAGLIRDIVPAREVIERIMAEAEASLQRLKALAGQGI
jgi:enoyl-[acyl-carrier protein] reductase II